MLLQVDTLQNALLSTEAPADEAINLIDLLMKGGWVMAVLLLLSFVTVYLFVQKIIILNKASKTSPGFMDQIRTLVLNGDINGAKMLCQRENTPTARMIEKGLSRLGTPLKNIEAAIENVGRIEIYKLEKNLPLLATISGAAPMIGFLGTVTGMIKAFMRIAELKSQVTPGDLSTGIYEAMITTAAGLVVGIVAYLAYNYLVTKVQKVIHEMEYSSIHFMDLLQEPTKV
ncbi:MAG: biopolymer transporter ExbB [Thermonema sp.]|jgi:biopolymer transport protein ExbB|uniref:MotA/TolQ/ExbB proton channel family protein n=1 Tax=Thermonema sp. TaxID=2231181 RepID=UPI0021DD9B7F|nr:MotA/TolQ/ExbB proton channel family protein [Thermonema sp.]GIV39192.1 MAG: biopolymer transporter ExbB [Thermonema sp.]